MEKIVNDYIASKNELKQKYDTIRTGKIYKQEQLKEQYQPITKPLEKLSDNVSNNRQETIQKYVQNRLETLPVQNRLETLPVENRLETLPRPIQEETEELTKEDVVKLIGKTAQKYLANYASRDIKTDKVFGTRHENQDLFIGNQPIWVRDDNIKFEDGTTFEGSEGLWELLTLEEPENYTSDDLNAYAKILEKTSSFRHGNDPNSNKIKASTGHKYNHIVKPLLIEKGIIKSTPKSGGSLILPTSTLDHFLKKIVYIYMNIQKGNLGPENIVTILDELKRIDLYANLRSDKYIYWDNLDELLQRIVVLYGEMESGNTNPSLKNEIIRILQELKELQ